jgi:hypothetical protein
VVLSLLCMPLSQWLISLLSTLLKITIQHFLSRLTPYAEEVTGHRQCGFRRIGVKTTDLIFVVRLIPERGRCQIGQ